MVRSKRASNVERRVFDFLEESGLTPVQVTVIGEDPGNHAIRALAVYKLPKDAVRYNYSSDSYSVMDIYDYHKCKDRRMRKLGMEKDNILSGVSNVEAIRFMNDRAVQLILDNTWFIPGTEELVPGCWGYKG
jgi:hypothetical protein